MDKKLVLGFCIVAIACAACYIAILKNNRVQIEDLANSIVYEEDQVIETVKLSGINSSTWDKGFNPYVYPQKGLGEADEIVQLPGQPKVSFRQYSGYVTVNSTTKRELFYYFAESPKTPTGKPLVVWLAEGTSCSSLLEVMTGLGPYRILSDNATLGLNPYAWNKEANILFLETPIGAGFSYSETKSDYGSMNEKLIAQDSYTFLINWLERFPAYKNRQFFIAGETYAGHYASQLARIILHMNKKENNTTVINLQGIMVANAILDPTCRSLGFYDFLFHHGIISHSLKETLKVCDFHDTFENIGFGTKIKCNSAYVKFEQDLSSPILAALSNPICGENSTKPQPESPMNWKFDPKKFDQCTPDYMISYMNKAQVREAFHAKGAQWFNCSNEARGWMDREVTVLLAVKEIMASGIRVLLYSGENEAHNNVEGIACGINAINMQIKSNTTWYIAPDEVGGSAFEYDNMTFVTLRGVSDHIQSYAPDKALTVFTSFLNGKPLPGAKLKLK